MASFRFTLRVLGSALQVCRPTWGHLAGLRTSFEIHLANFMSTRRLLIHLESFTVSLASFQVHLASSSATRLTFRVHLVRVCFNILMVSFSVHLPSLVVHLTCSMAHVRTFMVHRAGFRMLLTSFRSTSRVLGFTLLVTRPTWGHLPGLRTSFDIHQECSM